MPSPNNSGRKRTPGRQYSAEDQALNQIASEAERRLAARRAARAEAREIRRKELERQQKEEEEENEATPGKYQTPVSHYGPSSSLRDVGNDTEEPSLRELKRSLAELEEKYRQAMTNNATLDTEKQTYRYQADVIHDQLDELKEQHVELQRLHKLRGKDLDQKRRELEDARDENDFLKHQLTQRDELIQQYGLVFISNDVVDEEQSEGDAGKKKKKRRKKKGENPAALVTPEASQILQQHEGNLDDRLKKFASDQTQLELENKKLKMQLEKEQEKTLLADKYPVHPPTAPSNGPDLETLDIQMEIQKQLNDYKFKMQKAEQEITTFEGNVIRLEKQVKRYRQAAENSEKVEEELKQERRKLQRELREAQSQIEDIQTQNHHLQKRLERKTARGANI